MEMEMEISLLNESNGPFIESMKSYEGKLSCLSKDQSVALLLRWLRSLGRAGRGGLSNSNPPGTIGFQSQGLLEASLKISEIALRIHAGGTDLQGCWRDLAESLAAIAGKVGADSSDLEGDILWALTDALQIAP
jgi:hypothetical protein